MKQPYRERLVATALDLLHRLQAVEQTHRLHRSWRRVESGRWVAPADLERHRRLRRELEAVRARLGEAP